ncbi:MAG: J domain-containing protein [Fimbriimonadaceae bacterium]
MRDPYEVLGVGRDATPDEIKSAFRRLARQYHPDVNPNDPTAEERFKEVAQAHAILSDPAKRSQYDRYGSVEDQPGAAYSAAGFGDLFEMFFGGFEGAQAGPRGHHRDGDDLRADVTVTLQEVVTGVKKKVDYRRLATCRACHGIGTEGGVAPESCPKCNGTGTVTRMQQTFIGMVRTSIPCSQCGGTGSLITKPCSQCKGEGRTVEDVSVTVEVPPGVESGMTIPVPRRGNDGVGRGRTGDLYVVLQVADDPRFRRHGQDLHTVLELSIPQATLGDEVEVVGLDSDYDVQIPAGIQPGTPLRIHGAGLPPLHGGRRGDLVLEVRVQIPTKLSEHQVRLMKEFAKASGQAEPKGAAPGGLLGSLFKRKS